VKNKYLYALTILKWNEVFDRIESMILMVYRATCLLHRIAVKSDRWTPPGEGPRIL
jgi:hypothetical protein